MAIHSSAATGVMVGFSSRRAHVGLFGHPGIRWTRATFSLQHWGIMPNDAGDVSGASAAASDGSW